MLALERPQKRMIPGIIVFKYENHLIALGLYSLEFSRMCRDLIETYWIMKGLYRVEVESMFLVMGEFRTIGPSLRIKGCTVPSKWK